MSCVRLKRASVGNGLSFKSRAAWSSSDAPALQPGEQQTANHTAAPGELQRRGAGKRRAPFSLVISSALGLNLINQSPNDHPPQFASSTLSLHQNPPLQESKDTGFREAIQQKAPNRQFFSLPGGHSHDHRPFSFHKPCLALTFPTTTAMRHSTPRACRCPRLPALVQPLLDVYSMAV